MKPGLYIVATPIGNLGDITLRGLETLKNCDQIICEDTRHTQKLCQFYGIKKPFLVYHDHNAERIRPKILELLHQNQRLALVSDAGTPLISDPGFKLVRAVKEQGFFYTALPGASSVLAALILSGQPSDRFAFAGFIQGKDLARWASVDASLIFFETSKKIKASLKIMQSIFSNRSVSIVREISKIYEETISGSFEEMIEICENNPPRGELVLVLSPPTKHIYQDSEIDAQIKEALEKHSIHEISRFLSEPLGLSKKEIYQKALLLKKENF